MSKDKKINPMPVIDNRQARFNFELSEDFEAGIALSGWEVKAIRLGSVDMKDSYVLMKEGEAWIIGLKITPNKEVTFQVDQNRTRKLPYITAKIAVSKNNLILETFLKSLGRIELEHIPKIYQKTPIFTIGSGPIFWRGGGKKIPFCT